MTVYSSPREIPEGYYLADCAISGGTLRDYIQSILKAADGKLCVRLRPVYMDFPLPCPSGTGTPLTSQELTRLHQNAPCFFSESLCTEYFTYIQHNCCHVVLYDSLDSLRKKYQALRNCGVPMVLIEDPQLREKIAR